MGPAWQLRAGLPGGQVLLGEGSIVVLDGQRVLPERTQQAGFKFEFPSIDAAMRAAVM